MNKIQEQLKKVREWRQKVHENPLGIVDQDFLTKTVPPIVKDRPTPFDNKR